VIRADGEVRVAKTVVTHRVRSLERLTVGTHSALARQCCLDDGGRSLADPLDESTETRALRRARCFDNGINRSPDVTRASNASIRVIDVRGCRSRT
jgi:hypothetical protein